MHDECAFKMLISLTAAFSTYLQLTVSQWSLNLNKQQQFDPTKQNLKRQICKTGIKLQKVVPFLHG